MKKAESNGCDREDVSSIGDLLSALDVYFLRWF